MSGCVRFIGIALLAGCQSKKQQPVAALRPLNVLLVTIDTLRPDHLHCYGYPDVETPTLDALAQRGVLFENAVAQTPLTPPSHASIFTGQNPNVHKVRNTGGFILPATSHPLARILSEQGWDTAAFIGSAVMKKLFGFDNGFAVYDDEMPRPGNRNEFREDPERKASVVVDHAIEWLSKRPAGKPFFLWVHLYDPHIPYQPPAEFARKYQGRPYDGEIAYADQQLGRLFAAKSQAGRDRHRRTLRSRREPGRARRAYARRLPLRLDAAHPVPHGRARDSRRRAREAAGAHDRLPADAARCVGRDRSQRRPGAEPGAVVHRARAWRRKAPTPRRCTRR